MSGGVLAVIDASRQLRTGEEFALLRESGGTGRVDGFGWGLLQSAQARSTVVQYAPVTISLRKSGFSVIVEPIDNGADIPYGIALETPSGDYQGVPILLSGVTHALVTGAITAGDLLYAHASGRLSATPTSSPALGRALMDNASGDATIPVVVGPGAFGVAALQTQLITLPFVIDGGGLTITTGVKGDIGPFDFACTIEQWTLLADQSGSIVVDLWKDSYANYPPDVGDSITAAAKPTISGAVKAQGAPTGWTTAIAVGDTLRYNVDSVTSIQRATLALKLRRV